MADHNSSEDSGKSQRSTQSDGTSGVQHLGRIVTAPLRSSDANESVLYRAGSGAFALLGVVLIAGIVLALSGKSSGDHTKPAAVTAHQPPGTQPAHSGQAHPTSSHSSTPSAPPSSAHPAAATSHADKPKSTPAPTTHKPSPKPAPPAIVKVPLTVLNNTTKHGLAEQASDEFRGKGWQVAAVNNYAGRLAATTVYFTAGNAEQERSAHELAKEFGRITKVAPRISGLAGSSDTLIVVLAPDWFR